MEMVEIKEITINNDIYFLNTMNSKLIINNDYKGIFVLDKELSVLKSIDIVPDFCIYNAMVLSNEEVLFNCIENEIIYVVNIETNEIKKCKIPPILDNEILMEKVEINGTKVLLKTYKNHFFYMDLKKMDFSICDEMDRLNENEEGRITHKCIDSTIIDSPELCLNEYNIIISYKGNEYRILPKNGYRFLKSVFLHDGDSNRIVVVSGSNDNVTSIITVYCIK